MKRLILPSLALVALLVLAAVLWLARETEPRAPESAASAAHEATPDALAPLALGLEEPEAPEEESPRDERASAASAAASESWNLDESIWLTGSVRAPAGCADGEVEVFALKNKGDLDALMRSFLTRPKDGAGPFLSRRKVEPGGTFRLPFPPGTKIGHVLLLGSYQYTPEPIELDLAAGVHEVVLEPQCGALIDGMVTMPQKSLENDVSLSALDGVEVELETSFEGFPGGDPSRARKTRRRAKIEGGAFELRAVPAQSKYKLRIEPEALAAAEIQISGLRAGEVNPARFDLLRGGTLRGTVRSPDGALAGAEVEASTKGQWFGFDNEAVRKTTSQADGSFELRAVMPGKVVVRAKHAGWLEGDGSQVEIVDGGTLSDLVLELESGAAVDGTLTWADGTPAAKIEVELDFDMSAMMGFGAFNAKHGAEGTSVTDDLGGFRISGLGKGPFTVKAEALPPGVEIEDAKLRKKALHRARVDTVQPGTHNLALVLRAPEGLAGRVLDETGAPVPAFEIQAGRVGQGPLASLGQEKLAETFEDKEGRFLLTGLQEGTWKVYAVAKGFGPAEPVQIAIPRAPDEPELSIALMHAATIAGFVQGPSGGAVAGAKVEVDTGEANWQKMLSGGPPLPEAQSGPDGSFLLEGLKPGKIAIVAKAEDYAASLPVTLDVAPAQKAEGAVLALRTGGLLTGEVYQEGGAPGAGMMVQVTDPKRFDQQMGFSDAKGKFTFEHLAPGTWQVVAMPTGGDGDDGEERQDAMLAMVSKMKTAMVDIEDGEETHVVLGAPPADPVRVHGRVLHAGEPYKGALLTFIANGKNVMKGMKMAEVGKDGAYSILLDEPGLYSASVQKMSGGMGQQSVVEFTCEIPKEKEHELDFTMPTGRISGRIEAPDGASAANARVSLHPQTAVEAGTMWGGQYNELVADGDGHYDIQALRPGTYTLIAGGMSFGGIFGGDDAAYGREVRAGLKIAEGDWVRDVDFRLKRPGSIEVEVVDAAGAPVAEAAIFVRNTSGDLLDRFSFISTDTNGKRNYGGLAPGGFTFTARKDLLASAESSRVTIEEGGHAAVRLVLEGGTILVITVQEQDDKPAKVSLSVQDDQGREVGGMFALAEIMKLFSEGGGLSSTEHKIGPVPPGKYKVKATAPDGKTATKVVTLNGQPERKLTLRLP